MSKARSTTDAARKIVRQTKKGKRSIPVKKSGGKLIGSGKTSPKDGSKGGYAVGDKHSAPSGGISAEVGTDKTPIKFEGGEVVINAADVADPTLREFDGKMMTNKQILSKINSKRGVSFADGGDLTIFLHKKKMYNVGGKLMHGRQVIEYCGCGCKHELEKGGDVKNTRKNISLSDLTNRNADNSSHYQHYKRGGMMAKGGKVKSIADMTTDEFLLSLQKLRKFVPSMQINSLVDISRGEEREYAVEIMQRLLHTFETMPKTYQTERQETNEKVIYLHYFYGGMDWYIVERDSEPVQYQAFGYANLADDDNAEWGYISIVELMQTNKVELDFHWTPITFGQLKGNKEEKEVRIASEQIIYPTQTNEEEDDIDKDYNPNMGKLLKELFERYYSHGIKERYSIQGYSFDGMHLHLTFDKGEGGLDLSRKGRPESYSPNNYERLKELRMLLIQLQGKPHDAALDFLARIFKSMNEEIATTAPANKQQSTITPAQQGDINARIRSLVKEKGTDRGKYSADELALLKLYEGMGAEKKTSTDARILDQFFTPMDIIAKMWGIAFKHGFTWSNTKRLEPAVGSGRFLSFIPADASGYTRAYDVDETCATICKVLYPNMDVRHGSFEQEFFKGKRHIGMAGADTQFDLVIGNPPYREYVSEYAPLGEKDATGASTFEMYFIGRGVDVLKPGGLLIYIIPNTFLSNSSKYNDFKEKLARKADLIDAYRLPNGVFGNTDVGTDIIVLRKK